MIVPQAPPPPILVAGEAVADAEVPSQSLSTIAAIETDHVVVADRLPDRHSRRREPLLEPAAQVDRVPDVLRRSGLVVDLAQADDVARSLGLFRLSDVD